VLEGDGRFYANNIKAQEIKIKQDVLSRVYLTGEMSIPRNTEP
jgi:hypothetical protein